MNTQPEALRLADLLQEKPDSDGHCIEAATELRRLHEVNQELLEALKLVMPALRVMRKQWPRAEYDDSIDVVANAESTISKATGEQP